MKTNILRTISAISLILLTACSVSSAENGKETGYAMKEEKNTTNGSRQDSGDVIVDIRTTAGDITVRLYGDTPKHRDNFVKLVNEGFYDGTLFHRVIDKFMVQAGDPDSKGAPAGKMLGSGDLGYTIEAEFDYPHHFHKKGALAAARTGDNVNPEKRSSASQFYIVTGKTYTDSTLMKMEKQLRMTQKQSLFNELAKQNAEEIKQLRLNRDQAGLQRLQEKLIEETEREIAGNQATIPADVKEAYRTVGGTPHLDGNYTVFGEVIEGLDVIDKIQGVETDGNDRPLEDVKIISMTVVK